MFILTPFVHRKSMYTTSVFCFEGPRDTSMILNDGGSSVVIVVVAVEVVEVVIYVVVDIIVGGTC